MFVVSVGTACLSTVGTHRLDQPTTELTNTGTLVSEVSPSTTTTHRTHPTKRTIQPPLRCFPRLLTVIYRFRPIAVERDSDPPALGWFELGAVEVDCECVGVDEGVADTVRVGVGGRGAGVGRAREGHDKEGHC